MVHETSLRLWEDVITTNLTGTFLVLRAMLPLLLTRGGGAIVTIGSISADVIGAGGGCAAYEASKAGVKQLTRAVAAEYASQGIRANCVSPGRIRTSLGPSSRARLPAEEVGRIRNLPRRAALLRTAGEPAEIASLVRFLCSTEASFITGAEVVVDGGYTLL
jgi:NAD(P)-dependent dehydrogenase (short-subunit alcohol dehydrogenase family)